MFRTFTFTLLALCVSLSAYGQGSAQDTPTTKTDDQKSTSLLAGINLQAVMEEALVKILDALGGKIRFAADVEVSAKNLEQGLIIERAKVEVIAPFKKDLEFQVQLPNLKLEPGLSQSFLPKVVIGLQNRWVRIEAKPNKELTSSKQTIYFPLFNFNVALDKADPLQISIAGKDLEYLTIELKQIEFTVDKLGSDIITVSGTCPTRQEAPNFTTGKIEKVAADCTFRGEYVKETNKVQNLNFRYNTFKK